MSWVARFCVVALSTVFLVCPVAARDEATAAATAPAGVQLGQPGPLVPFASEEGLSRLARSDARADFAALANQFEAQSNAAFCGPTSAAIVLNALRGRNSSLPRDRSRLRPEDLQHLPGSFDLALPRYTQDNVITPGRKTRAQVLGEPITVNGKPTRDFGYQLRQFSEMLAANGVASSATVVDEQKADADIRGELVANLKRTGDFVIVGYKREALGQPGGGHISPLGAYDADTDSVLVLDVNPASAGWVWVPLATLVKAMRTFDTVENRGYVQVEAR